MKVVDYVEFKHYYPFGMPMPGRTFSSNQYRYGFNGLEKDDEIGKGDGNSYTTEFRQYDPRLMRWLSVDPLSDMYPSTSPYMYVLGRPTALIDPNGMNAWIPPTDGSGTWTAEAGDSPGSLANQAGISQSTAEGVMRNNNVGKNRSSDIMVYKGDRVNVPSTQDQSGGLTGPVQSSTSNSTTSSSGANNNNQSNSSPSNLVMKENLSNNVTPYFNVSTAVSSTLRTNAKSTCQLTVNSDMELQNITQFYGGLQISVGPNGVSTGNSVVSAGINSQGQFTLGISTPTINNVNYSAEFSFNKQQAKNTGIAVGALLLIKKMPAPVASPVLIPGF